MVQVDRGGPSGHHGGTCRDEFLQAHVAGQSWEVLEDPKTGGVDHSLVQDLVQVQGLDLPALEGQVPCVGDHWAPSFRMEDHWALQMERVIQRWVQMAALKNPAD